MSQRLQTYFPLDVHKLLIEYEFQFLVRISVMKELFATIAFVFVLLPAGLALVQRRIFNGREAIENEFPFMVSIRAAGMQCGGVIVSECFVLTAGHCLMNLFKGQVFTVVLGAHSYYKYSNETKEIIIRGNMTFSIHENFSMPSAEDDLGIIKLPSCVKFSDNINAVKVSTDLDIDQRKEVVTVIAGWGSTQIHYSADNLQTGEMKLLPISDCFQHQKHYVEKITKKHICATGLNSKPGHVVGPCNGDSGGKSPLSHKQIVHNQCCLLSSRLTSCSCRDTTANWHNELREGR